MTTVEIETLPKREFQRDYIDEFFAAQKKGVEYRIRGRKVVHASYGDCNNYPRGFLISFE